MAMAAISNNSDHLIPIAGRFLPNILTTPVKIVEKVKQTKINKRQCQTLVERIQRITFYLQKPELLKRLQSNNDPLNQTLENLQRFLEECYDFIFSYVDHSRIRKFFSSSSNKENFNYFNTQLQFYYTELTLGIIIKNFVEHEEVRNDQHELSTKITEPQTTPINQSENSSAQNNAQPHLKDEIFKDGIWFNRCMEGGQWQGPYQCQIKFNLTDNTCDGHGKDHVGLFKLTGSFSKKTKGINVVVSYKTDTKNSKLEVGNQYRFPLSWNEKRRLFEGLKYKPIGWIGCYDGFFELFFSSAQ